MAVTPTESTTRAPAESSRATLCPACGYDLRGSTGGRCSECGLDIDAAELSRSGIPWAYRRELGRVRAFLKTVWEITFDANRLRHEAAKPQSAHDAAVFRLWVTILVALSVAALAVVGILSVGIDEVIALRRQTFLGPMPPLGGPPEDLWVPWSAGVGVPGAMFVYAVLAAAAITRAPGAVIRNGRNAPDDSEAARALGRYATAPLAWLAPATAAFALAVEVASEESQLDDHWRVYLATAACFVLGVLAVGGVVLRTAQWRAHVIHGGFGAGLLAAGELLARWLVTLCVVLLVIPCCVGLLWIVIDSFRL